MTIKVISLIDYFLKQIKGKDFKDLQMLKMILSRNHQLNSRKYTYLKE